LGRGAVLRCGHHGRGHIIVAHHRVIAVVVPIAAITIHIGMQEAELKAQAEDDSQKDNAQDPAQDEVAVIAMAAAIAPHAVAIIHVVVRPSRG